MIILFEVLERHHQRVNGDHPKIARVKSVLVKQERQYSLPRETANILQHKH